MVIRREIRTTFSCRPPSADWASGQTPTDRLQLAEGRPIGRPTWPTPAMGSFSRDKALGLFHHRMESYEFNLLKWTGYLLDRTFQSLFRWGRNIVKRLKLLTRESTWWSLVLKSNVLSLSYLLYAYLKNTVNVCVFSEDFCKVFVFFRQLNLMYFIFGKRETVLFQL